MIYHHTISIDNHRDGEDSGAVVPAGDSGRRSKNGGPLTLALSPGGEGMKGRPASFRPQFRRTDVVFAGQSVVFPKVMCYVREGQWHNSFRNFRKAAISTSFKLKKGVQSSGSVGLFFIPRLRVGPGPGGRVPLRIPGQIGQIRPICRAPRGGGRVQTGRTFTVGERAGVPAPDRRPPLRIGPRSPAQNEIHPDALFGIADCFDPPPNQKGFLDSNPARATPRWCPSPGLSPTGKGENKRGKIQSVGGYLNA